jgi:hypothetical protein
MHTENHSQCNTMDNASHHKPLTAACCCSYTGTDNKICIIKINIIYKYFNFAFFFFFFFFGVGKFFFFLLTTYYVKHNFGMTQLKMLKQCIQRTTVNATPWTTQVITSLCLLPAVVLIQELITQFVYSALTFLAVVVLSSVVWQLHYVYAEGPHLYLLNTKLIS